MSKSGKVAAGIISFLPLIIFLAYLVTVLFFVFSAIHAGTEMGFEEPERIIIPQVFGLVVMAIIMALVSFAVLVYFIIAVINNRQIESTEKLIWVLVFLFAGMVGFPVYWYLRISKEKTETH